MNCPKCGYTPPRGRPKTVDDKVIAKLRKSLSVRAIAEKLGVSAGAVQGALRRIDLK